MTKRVTRKDVAVRAGVSETIVSYVLNGNRYVDKAKKERVLSAVKELGYRPSPVARALKGKESKHILFVVDDLSSEYFSSIIKEMEILTEKDGILFSLSSDNANPLFVDTVCNWLFDGIMICSATIPERDIQRIIDTGMPVVIMSMNDYPRFSGSYGLIFTGLREGVLNAMKTLRSKDRKKIAYVDSPTGKALNEKDFRFIGYSQALSEEELLVIDGVTMDELGGKVVGMYREKGFDAIFCRTDTVAAEAMKALIENGVRVPEDVSVVGVNDSRLASYTSPRLTSIAIRKNEVAGAALDLFRKLRSGEKEDLSVHLCTDFIERESV